MMVPSMLRTTVTLLFFVALAATSALAQEATPSTTSVPSTVESTRPASSVVVGDLKIGGKVFKGVRPVASRYKDLSEAVAVTGGNGVDEIYLKDEQGRLYIAYGYYGDIDQVKVGFEGTCGNKILRVVHVDNEVNTFSEGMFLGFKDVGKLLKPVTQNLGKIATGLGIGGAALIGAKLFAPVALAAATPALLTAATYGAGIAAAATVASWLYFSARDVILAYSNRRPATIAMVTGESTDELDQGMNIRDDQRRDRTIGETTVEALRRAGPSGESGGFTSNGPGSGVGPGWEDLPNNAEATTTQTRGSNGGRR